jgi:acetate kinase
MGFTPLEGLMMGTRCGSIDPGILLYLMREHQLSAQQLEHILNFESGLKGVGGFSDMRELLDRQTEALPHLAVRMFVHRLKTAIGALAASLDGFHVLSFTAGIGEHAPSIREQTCRGLSYLGVIVDQEKNQACQPDQEITASDSSVRILVLHTQEEWMIARACFEL